MNPVIQLLNDLLDQADTIYIAKGAKSYKLNSEELPVEVGIRFIKNRLEELRPAKQES